MRKILILLLFMCNLATAQEKLNTAVYMSGYEPEGTIGLHKVLSGELVKIISQSSKYIAIDRTEEILKLLDKEIIYQQGWVDEKQVKSMGKQLGVEYMVIAQVSEIMDWFYLEVGLVNVETAKVEKKATANSDLRNRNEMMQVTEYLALEVTGEGSGKPYVQRNRIGLRPFVPGMAQIHKGSNLKGISFIAGESVMICGIVAAEVFCADNKSKVNTTSNLNQRRSYIDNANNLQNARNILTAAATALYVWNIIDGFVAKGPSKDKLVKTSYTNLSVKPYYDSNSELGGLMFTLAIYGW